MRIVWVALTAFAACNPGQVLEQQARYATGKDYTGMAIDAKKKSDAEAATEAAKKKAADEAILKHVQAGQASMDLGEYETAAKEYKEAYRLSTDTKYLPQVAAAVRKTGDCTQAKTLYQEYLFKVTGSADRAVIEGRLKEAETCEKNLGNNFDKVRERYQAGVTHYELSEYTQAANEFKEAYRLSKDPTYLFNIAQSYRLAKNCGEALKFYQRYLSNVPDVENKDKVESYIADMKKCK